MTFEEAKKIAEDYFTKGGALISKIYDAEDKWIIYAEKDGKTPIGIPALTILKSTGELGRFILPNKENFAILKKAKLIFGKK